MQYSCFEIVQNLSTRCRALSSSSSWFWIEAFINAQAKLNMIARIPHRMVKLPVLSSRLFPGHPRYIPSCSARTPRYSNHFVCPHKRFHAYHAPGDPKPPAIQVERPVPHDAPDLVFEYDAFDRPIILERHRTIPTPSKRYLGPFIYGTICFLFGAAAGKYIRYITNKPVPPPSQE